MSLPMHALRQLLLALVLIAAVQAAVADADAEPSPDRAWQEVITSQIEAFRERDAETAFGFAGAGFHLSFSTAQSFFDAVISSGYAPIMESASHSFGPFELQGEAGVVQEVRIVGNDQVIYEATYQLTEEPAGWRVQGVQLRRTPGLAI